MSANLEIAKAILDGPARQLGENGHAQFTVSGATRSSDMIREIQNKFVALNFLLVRGVDKIRIDTEVDTIIHMIGQLADESVKFELNVTLLVLAAYQRDIEDGKGERVLFYHMIFKLWQVFPHAVEVLLRSMLPTEHACWKDVQLMIETLKTEFSGKEWALALERFLFGLFVDALKADMVAIAKGEQPSLACKWAPRQQSHFGELAKVFARALFPEIAEVGSRMKAYRKFLSSSTEKSKTVESLMCGGEWDKINPGAVPSKAMKIYRLALQNKTKNGKQRSEDPKRVALSQRLIQFLASGKKVHGKTLMVHEIITQLRRGRDEVLEAQMKSIVNDFCAIVPEDLGLVLPLADVSGSMQTSLPGSTSTCMDVSIALAFLLSQLEGPFKDKVMTFDTNPKIFDLKGATIFDKIQEIQRMPWGVSTDFGKAMDYIFNSLKDGVADKTSIKSLTLIVFSDMQFNKANRTVGYIYNSSATVDKWSTAQERIEAMYTKAGFPVPRIVYWNLNARHSAGFPAHAEEKNVVMLSGFNQSALKTFLKGDILPTIEEQAQAMRQEKDPWDVLENSLANYIWLMQAFETANIFPGYKAPVVEDEVKDEEKNDKDEANDEANDEAKDDEAKDDDWENVDDEK